MMIFCSGGQTPIFRALGGEGVSYFYYGFFELYVILFGQGVCGWVGGWRGNEEGVLCGVGVK